MSRKFALVIGNTEYTDSGLAQLTAPGRDAEDFARVLKDPEISAFDHVDILVNQPSSSVIEVIDEFFDQKKPDDLLVLYFSGHGVKDEMGSLYLAFKNTVRTRLRSTAIKSDYIREAMDQSRSKRQVVILDCCNSGAFPAGTKAETGGAMGMTQAFQGYGRFVLTASDATQFAWEGDKVIGETKNSLFTHFLVKGLQGEADLDGDGKITVDELYDYSFEQISRVTPNQTPTKSSSKVEGEIVLRQFTRIEDIKPMPLPDDVISEMDDVRPYVREEAVKKLDKILKGKNIGMARSAVEALEKIAADENTTRRVAQAAQQALDAFHEIERKAEEERQSLIRVGEELREREKAEAERKAREDAEREAASLKAKKEADELAALQAEKETARKKADREAAERAVVERAKRENAEKIAKPSHTIEKSTKPSYLKWVIAGVIGLCIMAGGAWGISYLSGLGNTPTQLPATEMVPTDKPATNAPAAQPITNPTEITLWHAYGTGSAEEIALSKILDNAAIDLPQYKINVVQIPFNDIFNKYRTDVAAGGGPDVYIVPNDSLGDDARAGLLADITSRAEGKLAGYNQLAIDGMTVDSKLYGIPESLKAVAFWYNKDLLPTPPATTDDLGALMNAGTPIGMSYGCYHMYGFYNAFGGKLFDENWRFIADQGTGVTDTFVYLNDLYQISRAQGWPVNDSDSLIPFAEGRLAAVVNGNWAMGDYRSSLGDRLAVAALPAGPAGPAAPLLGVDGFYFNPNSANLDAALDVALYLTNSASQSIMVNEAGHVPVRSLVISDPLIQGLVNAFNKGVTVRPQAPELARYWANFCDTDQIYERGISPADFVHTATENANK